MNIWDSVHRGLEKASNEAARIARAQRLRSNIDKLTRQIVTQQQTLEQKTMELFTTGLLKQPELVPLCQELLQLHQQITQANNELQQLSNQGAALPSPSDTQANYPPQSPNTPYPTLPEAPPLTPTIAAPSQYQQPYHERTTPASGTIPPPPPGIEPVTLNTHETVMMHPGTPPPPPGLAPATISSHPTIVQAQGATPESSPAHAQRVCSQCGTEAQADNRFCQNCGATIQPLEESYQPTVRGSSPELSNSGSEGIKQEETTSTSEDVDHNALPTISAPVSIDQAPDQVTNQEGGI